MSVARTLTNKPPSEAAPAWRLLRDELGPQCQAAWNLDSGVLAYAWGHSVVVPNSVSSPAVAAAHARALLDRHIDLLAPGARGADFVLIANHLSAGQRAVGFQQRTEGLRVLSGQLSFRYKNDRLFMIASQAVAHAEASPISNDPLAKSIASAKARAWVLSDMASHAATSEIEGPFVLPLGPSTRTVWRVGVEARSPRGYWQVYVDATDGELVAREQILDFASGTVLFNAPQRRPNSVRIDYPASFAALTLDNASVSTDAAGIVSWSTMAPASIIAVAQGSYVSVDNDAGDNASTAAQLPAGGSALWDGSATATIDAQIATFVHTNRAIAHLRGIDPALPYLETLVPTLVNIDDECNAFFNRKKGSLNFYAASANCANMARLADVVYHEYGHAIHYNSVIDGVGAYNRAVSEGLADYLSATITGDPAVGRGFYHSAAPLRHIDPPNFEYVWPEDISENHAFGQIISGALWDLRKLMITKYGEAQGASLTDQLYYQAMRRAVDIPSMYFEVLAADDDDGDLDNGTPNICEIDEAFGAHGLRQMSAELSKLDTEPPSTSGFDVSLNVLGGLQPKCGDAEASATLVWRLRGSSGDKLITMDRQGDVFSATIPSQPDGSVVTYRIELHLGPNNDVRFPHNPADPYYELFVGYVEEIYCTDFETDPALDGWTHGQLGEEPKEGGDDWQWGSPSGIASSGDPAGALSGEHVYGNDLGAGEDNGKYMPEIHSFADSPIVDVSGYEVVRLQYRRWLNVEDGFYDQATIFGNGVPLWTNFNSGAEEASTRHHQDKEWRFHDVELSEVTQDDKVQVRYAIKSDKGLHLGGWTLDDWCIVGWVPLVCGDGKVMGPEECDDGEANSDSLPDACRSDCMKPSCGDGVTDSAEACDDGNELDDDDCDNNCQPVVEPPPPDLPDGGADPNPTQPIVIDQGCGCRVVGRSTARISSAPRWGLALLVLGQLLRRRRRRPAPNPE